MTSFDDSISIPYFSAHGTYIGNFRLEKNKPTQLPVDSVFRFGESTRRFALANSFLFSSITQKVCYEREASDETQACHGRIGEDRCQINQCQTL